MRTVYVSGPITATSKRQRDKHINIARRYAERLWKMGFGVLTPHLNDLGMEYNAIPYEHLMKFDLLQVAYMDTIYMLPGWRDSPGAVREFQLARRLKKPVFFTLKGAKEWLKKNK